MPTLILAHPSDAVAGQVGDELAARGVPVARLNPSDFPRRVAMAARMSSPRKWAGTLTLDGGDVIELADVHTVWRRQASQFVLDERMSAPEKAFAYGEARRGFGGVLAALGQCRWVNDPVAAARAEYKPVQLAAASEVGFRMPETLITSDPQAAHDWAKQLGHPIVYKTLSGVWHADEGQVRLVYTTPVEDPSQLLDPRLCLTAHLFQEQVDVDFAIRAIVVSDRVFAARIDAGSQAARQDWRADYDALEYSVIDLPDDVVDALVGTHRRLGLVYGAADLLCDTSGRLLFIETNQNGEFGWIADATGLPITSALADLLEGP